MITIEIAGLPGVGKTTLMEELKKISAPFSRIIRDNRPDSGAPRAAFRKRAVWRVGAAARYLASCLSAGSESSALWRSRKEILRLVKKLSYRETRIQEAFAASGSGRESLVLADSGFVQPLLESCCRTAHPGFMGLALAMLRSVPFPRHVFVMKADCETVLRRYLQREGHFFEGLSFNEAEAACRRGEEFLQAAVECFERHGWAVDELDGSAAGPDLAEELSRRITEISRRAGVT